MTRITTLDLPSFQRATIGFDRIFNELERQFANSASSGYPPYNIAQVTDDEYVISLAVAGFTMDNLEITHDNDVLSIEGTAPGGDEETNYLHKGIAGRNFRRQFTLADHVKVVRAELDLGMLNIYLQREIPEELQPKKIEIEAGKGVTIEG